MELLKTVKPHFLKGKQKNVQQLRYKVIFFLKIHETLIQQFKLGFSILLKSFK